MILSRFFIMIWLLKLILSVNQAPRPVAEKHVNFLRFDNCRYFALTECSMLHRLTFAIFARSVVWRSRLAFVHRHRGFDAAAECAGCFASFAKRFRDLSFFGYRFDGVILFRITRRTHHFRRLTGFKNFIFHNLIYPSLSGTSRTK